MSKEFELENFKVKVVVSSDSTLSISYEQPQLSVKSKKDDPKPPGGDPDPLIFAKKVNGDNGSHFVFWNMSTKTYVKDRPRPTQNIGDWNPQRILATAFLEKLMNVNASKLQDQKFIAAYGDPGWEAICKHIKL